MEIQDLKNSPIMTLLNKGAFSVDGAKDAAFSGLLKQLDSVVRPSSVEVEKNISAKKADAERGVSKKNDDSKDYIKENDNIKESNISKGEEKTSKKKKTSESAVNANGNEANEAASHIVKNGEDVSNVVNEVSAEVVDVEKAASILEAAFFEDASVNFDVFIDGEKTTFADAFSALQNGLDVKNVTVLNLNTNEKLVFSGKDFMSVISENILPKMQSSLSEGGIDISGFDILPQGEDFNFDVSKATNENILSDVQSVDLDVEDGVEVVKQPLSNVDIKVTVEKDSKAPISTTSELIKDKGQINEIIFNKLDDVSPSIQSQSMGADVTNAMPENIQNTMSLSSDIAVGSNVVDAWNGVGVASPSSVVAENVNVVATSSIGVSGNGFIEAARAENANSRFDNTLRDVYKGLGKDAVEQVKVNIIKSAVKGVDKIDVSLKPQELGNIEIKMQISKDGKLNAHIIASRPETMELLQKETASLEQAFRDAGFQTEDGGLSFSLQDNNQANKENNSSLRDFMGNALENEDTDIVDLKAVSGESWGQNGLNIKV